MVSPVLNWKEVPPNEDSLSFITHCIEARTHARFFHEWQHRLKRVNQSGTGMAGNKEGSETKRVLSDAPQCTGEPTDH